MTATNTLTRPATSDTAVAPASAGIPFGRLLRVEWGKATDTRAARWLIVATATATVLIMLAPLLARHSISQTYVSYLGFASVALTTLLPVVAILTLTTEWTQRTVLTTFTQEPRRERVIGAKVAVAGILAGLAVVFGAVVTAGALAIAAASGRQLADDLSPMVVFGFVLVVALNMLMGVAFGSVLHNTAASIVLFFLLPTVFGILGATVHSVGHWTDPSTTFTWVQDGEWSGHSAQIGVSVLLWVVAPLVAGLVRTARREIK